MATWWRLCVCSLEILLLVPCSFSEKFSLAGSPHPVVGVVGQDVVLPCQLSPPARLPSMDVWWRKIESQFIPVHEYSEEGTQDLPGDSYQNRTELFLQEFSSGNVSLKLKRLQVVDDGKYQCFVRNPEWSREATIELRVAAVAPVFIDVLGPRGQGIDLACKSTGWFPKPKLQWVGKNWQNLAMEIVTDMTQDGENLYSVVSHVTVTEGEENGNINCIVRNSLLETERQSAIHLSDDIFPHVSPWLAAFWVLFTLVLIAAGACAYLGYAAKRKASQKKCSKEEALFIHGNDTARSVMPCDDVSIPATVKCTDDTKESQDLHQLLTSEKNEKKLLKSETEKDKNMPLESETEKRKNKELESELKVQHQKIETEKRKNKMLESECQELREKLEVQKKTFESECQKLRESLDAQKKAYESECGQLRRTIETEKDKNMRLESDLKVQHQKMETEENKKKQLESGSLAQN